MGRPASWRARGTTSIPPSSQPRSGSSSPPDDHARRAASAYHRALVSNLTPQEVARQAALDADYVDELIRLGILRPDDGTLSPADVRRARWVQSLERAGVPLE